jgi:hypothetical protein
MPAACLLLDISNQVSVSVLSIDICPVYTVYTARGRQPAANSEVDGTRRELNKISDPPTHRSSFFLLVQWLFLGSHKGRQRKKKNRRTYLPTFF